MAGIKNPQTVDLQEIRHQVFQLLRLNVVRLWIEKIADVRSIWLEDSRSMQREPPENARRT